MKKFILAAFAAILSFSTVQAQEIEEKKPQVHLMLKDGSNPDIYVDGKKFEFSMDLIDPNIIESVNVIKGEKALKEYNSKNGVVLITTKEKTGETNVKVKKFSFDGKNSPTIIIDGKKSTKDELKSMSPEKIESINVLKDQKNLEKYNSPNGVILITTKKK